MSRILVAYFSATGTTERLARTIARAVGADLHEIRPAQPYTGADLDWTNPKSRRSVEMRDKAFRPEAVHETLNVQDVDTLVLEFPIIADYALLPVGDRTLVLTHGHKNYGVLGEKDVLVNGHFHVPAFERREKHLYVNCGSVSIPKENSPHSCLVLQDGTLLWKDVETGEIFRRETL